MKGYRTVAQVSETEYIVQKSRFIGHCYPVQSEEEALEILERIRKRYWDARHNCYAYCIGENSEIARFSDDGEPSGTAGLPMIEVIKKSGLTNLLCIVTRYFGGILLGAGGLVRAYTRSTADAIREAGCLVLRPCVQFDITVPYTLWGKAEPICREFAMIEDIQYLEVVQVVAAVPEDRCDAFLKSLTDRTDGRITPVAKDTVLRAFGFVPENEKE